MDEAFIINHPTIPLDRVRAQYRTTMSVSEFALFMPLFLDNIRDGGVPSDPVLAVRAAGLDSDAMGLVKSILDKHFRPTESGLRSNELADEIRQRAIQKILTNRENAQSGGKHRRKRRLSHRSTDGSAVVSTSTSTSTSFPSELETEAFQSAWMDWTAYRREAKLKVYTPIGVKKQLNRLVKEFGHDGAIAAIEFSIANGYQGIYAGGGGNQTNRKGQSTQGSDRPLSRIEAKPGKYANIGNAPAPQQHRGQVPPGNPA